MNKTIVSHSPSDTEKAAEEFSAELIGGEVIAFIGELGMGKTCFVRGLARGLGFTGEVTSPTFSLINEYRGGRLDLFHFDMYRVDGWEDLYSTGYFDYVEANGVVAVEWSENIAAALTDSTVFIKFERLDDTSRKITFTRGERP